jgi:tetratricopeptide (TPR) repeat protein
MIASSVDTKDFVEIQQPRRFLVEPPHADIPFVNDSVEVRPGAGGAGVSIVARNEETTIPSVERTLDDILLRCKRQVKQYPLSSRARVNLALALTNRGYSEEGIQELQRALDLDKKDFSALTLLAALHFRSSQLDESERLYREIIKNYPKTPTPYVGLASIALRKSDFQAAAEWLDMAVDLDESLSAACYLLAMIHLHLNKPNQAIAVLRRALRNNVRSAELNQGLAVAFLIAQDLKHAERSFQTAIALNPKFSAALHGLALLYLQQKRSEDAISLLSRYLDGSPSDIQGRELLANAYAVSRQFRQARSVLQDALSVEETKPQPNAVEAGRFTNNIGAFYAAEGKFAQAEELISRAIDLAPAANVIPHENLVKALLAQGKYQEALEATGRAIRLRLSSANLALLREVCLVYVNRHEDAISVLRDLLATPSPPVQAYADLGWLLTDWRGDYPRAIEVLERGLEKVGEDTMLLNNLAYAHLMNGEPSKARPFLERISGSTANQVHTLATMGLLFLWEGDIEAGNREYKRAEDVASQEGKRPLMLSVRQKKFLELARAFLRSGDPERAKDAIASGLKVPEHPTTYGFRWELEDLARELE